jgi:hypothetical protein
MQLTIHNTQLFKNSVYKDSIFSLHQKNFINTYYNLSQNDQRKSCFSCSPYPITKEKKCKSNYQER